MPTAELHTPRTTDVSHKLRKRSAVRRRVTGSIGYIALGVLLWYGWHRFEAFDGPMASISAIPHDHPMHRVVEAAIFLAVAIVPVVIYFILRPRSRGRN